MDNFKKIEIGNEEFQGFNEEMLTDLEMDQVDGGLDSNNCLSTCNDCSCSY